MVNDAEKMTLCYLPGGISIVCHSSILYEPEEIQTAMLDVLMVF